MAPMMDEIKRIGKYELLEHLGGGMSQVFRARDTVIGRNVAVKILKPEASKDPDAKARFLREARTVGNIVHDNIMQVYDFGEAEGRPYMVMEFLRGQDLASALKKGETGDLASQLRIATQIASALEHIHGLSIVHRDIKPENVHVSESGVVKIMDFGIAKPRDYHLTQEGFTLGTPYYMAPEQIRGDNVTHLVDVYAFGILLFELLARRRPFEGETIDRIFFQILNDPVPVDDAALKDVPHSLREVIRGCTEKDAAARPQSMAEVRKALQAAAADLDAGMAETVAVSTPSTRSTARRTSAPAPVGQAATAPPDSRKGLWMGIAAAAVLLVLGGLVWALFLREPAANGKQTATGTGTPELLATPTGDMILIPAGQFLSGISRQPVEVPAFYIDKTEVSNAAWAAYLKATGKWDSLPTDARAELDNRPHYPAANVTIDEARQFASWAGKRLPTALEWEKAARGPEGRLFPWGDAGEPYRANVRDNPELRNLADYQSTPVDHFSEGQSHYGVLNMVGNVWEFVDSVKEPSDATVEGFNAQGYIRPPATKTEPWVTIYGGGFDYPLRDRLTYDYSLVPARYRNATIGFRCVKTVP